MRQYTALAAIGLLVLLAGCDQTADAQPTSSVRNVQPGHGEPYLLADTQVWTVPDKLSGRTYQVYVALPADYDEDPNRTYPVLYVTDANYAFPIVRQLARRMNLNGPVVRDHILVGLSYAEGDDPAASRTRDYTPSSRPNAEADAEGGGPAYQAWLKSSALPFVEGKFRADPGQRILLGHSFGSLLGAQILLSEPEMFSGYLLGSPSLWFNGHQMFRAETDYAARHTDLKAKVFMYIGEQETRDQNNRYDMVDDNRRFDRVLKSRSYPGLELTSAEIKGEDHLTVAPIGFMRGLEALLPAQ